ncbi:MAG: right-handed parallel beta-helix repeat-containing protein [Solirubrobacterales bacterium]
MKKFLIVVCSVFAVAGLTAALPATAAAKKKNKTQTVCKFGCDQKKIQKAVDKLKGKKDATVKVEPGTYKEGVVVEGKQYNGLTIKGTKKNPKKVVLEGKNAKNENGLAQNGIEVIGANNVTVKNMTAQNYATNGFFYHECKNYTMSNLRAKFNRSYGLYAFDCKGGEMSKSEAWGHGDSGYYVGATPVQNKNPKKNVLKKLEAYKNVLGFSGTNSHYVTIKDSYFYNNGAGVVPNTLDVEPYEPAGDSVIRDNYIFWNNFNYFLPNSPVGTVGTGGLGKIGGNPINYPTGVGVVLFGTDNVEVKNNEIFGNFKWGTAVFSDPFNEGDNAISTDNMMTGNKNGRGGNDTNAVDYFSDGSGSGNCYAGNSSSTFDPSSTSPNSALYPPCPAPPPPAGGTGTSAGDFDQQIGDLLGYVTSNPFETQQCSWTEHPHPPFEDFKPFELTPGPACP